MTDYPARIEQFTGAPPDGPLPEIIDGLCQYGEAGAGQPALVCRLVDGHDGDHDLRWSATPPAGGGFQIWLEGAGGWQSLDEYLVLTDDMVDRLVHGQRSGQITGLLSTMTTPPPEPTPIERALAILAPHLARERLYEPGPSSFTCPVCGRTSHHPMDRKYGYCGACHDYTGTPEA
jgi:hypothetical protein